MRLCVHGREAFVYTGGTPFDVTRPCLVMLHGAVCDHTVFTLLARWFAHHGFAVLAPDLPGHMRSEGPALTGVEALADWSLALLAAAGVARAAWVGHSMGSLVALQAAANAPARATHLALLGSCVPMPVPQALLDLALADVDAAVERVVGFSFSTLAAKPSYPGPGSWLRGAARGLMQQVLRANPDPRLFHDDFAACNAYAGGFDAADRIACPALLVLGEADQMTAPRQAKALAERLRARTVLVPSGHFMMQEAPDAVLASLRGFLAVGATA